MIRRLAFLVALLAVSPALAERPAASTVITDVTWATTHIKDAVKDSDKWGGTWYSDGRTYTVFGDGTGLVSGNNAACDPENCSMDWSYVTGGPPPPVSGGWLVGVDINSDSATTGAGNSGKKGAGILSVGNYIYTSVSNARASGGCSGANCDGCTIWWADATDPAAWIAAGAPWTPVGWVFGPGDTAANDVMGSCTLMNAGQNYGAAQDGYVYIVSADDNDAYEEVDTYILARVPANHASIIDETAWEWYTSTDPATPTWSTNSALREAILTDTYKANRADMTYVPGIDRYLLAGRSRCRGSPPHADRTNHFTIYDAPKPWGPWTIAYTTTSACSGCGDMSTMQACPTATNLGWGESAHIWSMWLAGNGLSGWLVYAGDDDFTARQFTLTVATPGQYYVRTDGHDTNCTGLTNAAYPGSGSGQPCAFKTIGKGESTAVCGETVNVAAGSYWESAQLAISDNCTAGSQKKIIGAGKDVVTLHALAAGGTYLSCALKGGTTNTYECDVPSGGNTALDDEDCLVQRLNGTVDLEWRTGVTKTTASGYICINPSPTETCDPDGSGGTFGNSTPLDDTACRGVYTYDSGSGKYEVHLWNSEVPGTGLTRLIGHSTGTKPGVNLAGADYATVQGMTITSGKGHVIEIKGTVSDTTNNTLLDIDAYNGGVWILDSASGGFGPLNTTLTNFRSLNGYKRFSGYACGHLGNGCPNSGDNSQGITQLVLGGDGTLATNIEAYGGHEGLSFRGRNQLVKRIKTHGFSNHGCKIHEVYEDSIIENLVSFNHQEPCHIVNCQRDIVIRHATFGISSGGGGLSMGMHEQFSADFCPEDGTGRLAGQWNIDMCNVVFSRFNYANTNGPDSRAGARGFDDESNVYFGSYAIRHLASDTNFTTIAAWRAWATDTCSNCTRDASATSFMAADTALFVDATWSCGDLSTCALDLRPKAGSPLINAARTVGSCALSEALDANGDPRDGQPDIGAYEYQGAVAAQCADTIDNDGDGLVDLADDGCVDANDNDERLCGDAFLDTNEQCDGALLGGDTCITLGFTGGDLGCTGSCTFDTSGCTMAGPTPGSRMKAARVRGGRIR